MRVSWLVPLSFLEPSASWQQLFPQTIHSYHRSTPVLLNVGFLDAKKRSPAFVGGALYMNQDVEEEREDDMPTRFEDFLNSDEKSFELKPANKADTLPMMPAPRRRATPPVMPAPRKRLEKPPRSSRDPPASPINKELSAFDAYLASDNLSPISGGTSNDESNPTGKKNINTGGQSPFLAFLDSDETSFNSCTPSEETPVKQSVNPPPSIGAQPTQKELSAYDAYLASENLPPIFGGNNVPTGTKKEQKSKSKPSFLSFLHSDDDVFESRAPPSDKPQLEFNSRGLEDQYTTTNLVGGAYIPPSGIFLEGASPFESELVDEGGQSPFLSFLESTEPTFQGQMKPEAPKEPHEAMSLEEAQTVDLADTFELTDRQRQAWSLRDDELQRQLAAQLDLDEQEENGRVTGMTSLFAPEELSSSTVREMVVSANPADEESNAVPNILPVETKPVEEGGRSPFVSFLESTEPTFQGQMKPEAPKEPHEAMSLEEAQTVDLADTFELTDRQRQAWLLRDDELQRQLAAQLDLDEQEEKGSDAGRTSLFAPEELSSSTVDKLREMLVSANPADEESNAVANAKERVGEESNKVANAKERVLRIFRGVTKERLLVFTAGGLTVVLGQRLLRLLIGGGML